MNLRLAAVILAGIVLGGVTALTLRAPGPTPSSGTTTGKAAVGGPFELTNQDGKRVSDQDFRGKLMLIYFGYTFCPDVCPAGLQVIAGALDKLGAKADQVTPVFISLDPERDTPAKLKEYLSSFSGRIVGLTGTPDDIAKVAKEYRAYYKKVPDPKHPADYTVDHTSIIYIMDRDGNFVSHATHATNVEALTGLIQKAM